MPTSFRLLLASYTFFTVAWLVGNPPGAAPDEASQYIKALGVSAGVMTGEPVHYFTPPVSPVDVFDRKLRRLVPIPRRLDPARFADPTWNFGCNAGRSEVSAGCLDALEAQYRPVDKKVTNFGTYPPFVYGPAGVAMRGAPNALVALYVGRAVTAVAFLLFLSATLYQLRAGSGIRTLSGVLVAVTPMALFSASSLSSSGYEIGAGLALSASVIRLVGEAPPRRLSWPILAASGVVLAVARPLGPLWIAVIGAVALVAVGPARCLARVRAGGWSALMASAAVAVAIGSSVAWQSAVQPPIPGNTQPRSNYLDLVLGDQGFVYRQQIGNFGWLDTKLPPAVYDVWTLLLGGLVVVALVRGRWRNRAAMVVAFAAVFAAMMLMGFVAFEIYGFPASLGRWVLPVSVLIPLLAAGTVRSTAWLRRLAPPLVAAGAVVIAVVHGLAWYVNAHRHAVGSRGPWFFASAHDWSPPLGWWFWMALTGVAVLTMAASGVIAARAETSNGAWRRHA